MKLLLDTHALVWAAVAPEKLSVRVRDLLHDLDNDIVVSAACAYEIEFKRDRDASLLGMPLDLERAVIERGFGWLEITPSHAAAAGRLPRLHGDPFDRILVAQALLDGLPLVSIDEKLPAYGVAVIW